MEGGREMNRERIKQKTAELRAAYALTSAAADAIESAILAAVREFGEEAAKVCTDEIELTRKYDSGNKMCSARGAVVVVRGAIRAMLRGLE